VRAVIGTRYRHALGSNLRCSVDVPNNVKTNSAHALRLISPTTSSVICDRRRFEVTISRLDRNVNIIIFIGVVVVEWLRVGRLANFDFHLMTLGKLFTHKLY